MSLTPFRHQRRDVLRLNKAINGGMKDFFSGMIMELQLLYHASGDLTDIRNRNRFLSRANFTIQSKFLGSDMRSAYAADGTTPLSQYAQLINKSIALGAQVAIRPHKLHLEQLRQSAKTLNNLKIGKMITRLQVTSEQVPAPVVPHTVLSPSGYVLSDSIWNLSHRTAMNFNRMITDAILSGRSATQIANMIEAYLLPGRSGIRTTRPYGRNASYDAMRLARTEAMSAYNRIALAAIRNNPYIEYFDIARSGAGDPECTICPDFVTIDMSGGRVAPPFSVAVTPPSPPYHPHCMCYVLPSIEAEGIDIQAIIDELELEEDSVFPTEDDWIALILGIWIIRYLRGNNEDDTPITL